MALCVFCLQLFLFLSFTLTHRHAHTRTSPLSLPYTPAISLLLLLKLCIHLWLLLLWYISHGGVETSRKKCVCCILVTLRRCYCVGKEILASFVSTR